MALSNMKVEPRREITESLVGTLFAVGLVVGDYYLSVAEVSRMYPRGDWDGGNVAAGMLVNPLVLIAAAILLTLVVYLTHFVGEVVCDLLKSMKVDPRPKQRYKQSWVHDGAKIVQVRVKIDG